MLKKVQGASWDSIFLIVVRLLTTLTTIMQTRVLSVGLTLQEYGSYSQAILVASIATSFIMLGLGDGLNYFYNRKTDNNNDKNIFVNTIFLIEIIVGTLGLLAICFSRNIIAKQFGNPDVSILLCIISIKPMLDNVSYLYQLLFISIQKAKVIAIRNLIISIAKVAIIWYCVQFYSDVKVICASLVILDVLNWIIFKWLLSKEGLRINIKKADLKLVKNIVSYSFPMGVYALTSTLLRDVDKLVVGKLASTSQLAIYANCSKILPFDLIATSFATVLIPYIMRYVTSEDKNSMEKLLANYIRIGYYSVWTFAVSVLITSEQVIDFLYSSKYIVGKSVFILYLFDSMIRFACFHLVLTAKGHSKDIMIYSFVSLIANLLLNVVLYPILDLMGPAVATVLVTLTYTFLIIRKTILVTGIKFMHVVDWGEITRFIGELIILGILFIFIKTKLVNMGVDGVLSMFLVIIGFCSTVFAINTRNLHGVLREFNSLKI